MKNLMFKDETVSNEFEKLCDIRLISIIEDFIKNYQLCIVNKVYFEKFTLNILLSIDDIDTRLSFNYKEMKTYISMDKKDYIIVYDNNPKKEVSVKCYLYQKDNKTLIKNNIDNNDLSNKEKRYSYLFYINDKCYEINILDYNNSFIEEDFMKYVLSSYLISVDNVDQMYSLFVNSNSISDISLEIIDRNNNDELLINNEIIMKYHITSLEDDIKREFFLDNNKFYEKDTTVKEISDNKICIKKIGGLYGKRKKS